MEKEFIKALRETIREQILQNNSVDIDGFGSFEAIHEQQRQKRSEDGRIRMMPPRDIVVFKPEKQRKG